MPSICTITIQHFSKNIHVISLSHGTTNTLPVTESPSYHVEHLTWNHVYSKENILRSLDLSLSRAAFLWCRNRSDFSNSLKGKVWIVHCQIKSCSAATQHLTNEIQISVWSCAMNLESGISLYEPNYSIWKEDCAHFLKLKSLLGAAGLMAAGCFTKGFYFVMFCITQGGHMVSGKICTIQQWSYMLIFPKLFFNVVAHTVRLVIDTISIFCHFCHFTSLKKVVSPTAALPDSTNLSFSISHWLAPFILQLFSITGPILEAEPFSFLTPLFPSLSPECRPVHATQI